MPETTPPDPQAILKMLEVELALKRQQRKSSKPSRAGLRVGSLIVMAVLLGMALIFLHHLADRARAARLPEAPHPMIMGQPISAFHLWLQ